MHKYADKGNVYTWGWKECVPSAKITRNMTAGVSDDGDASGKQVSVLTEQGNSKFPLVEMSIHFNSIL